MADTGWVSRGFDLHTHSSHSDGTTTPTQIAQAAAQLGLAGFALTDHDTTAGWDEARAAGIQFGIDFLPGIELTTHTGSRSTHLLAFGPDLMHPDLREMLSRLRESRVLRAREMTERLAHDFPLDWESVLQRSGRSVGRPHLADALVDAGFVQDRSTAFTQILTTHSPYYVPIFAFDSAEAIRTVRAAGGATVLAHPAAQRSRSPFSREEIERLSDAGLWGLELEHPENLDAWIPPLRELAEQLGLRVTGASDYHGAGKPNRLGECSSSLALVSDLREAVAVPS